MNELFVKDLNDKDGIAKISAKLDEVFLPNKIYQTFNSYQALERFKRSEETDIAADIVEFEQHSSKLETSEMKLPDCVFAYKLLYSAMLNDNERILVLG